MGFIVREVIERPRDEVWSAATDWGRASEWMDGIEELRPLTTDAVGKGTRLGFRARGSERESSIVEWVPGERFVLQSRQGGITADYAYSFRTCDSGTEVTLRAGCRGEGFGWRLAAPLIGVLMARADRGQLAAMKKMLERSASGAS